MNKDDIDFPALSAHAQDGRRRGKVSVIANLATPPTHHRSYRPPLATHMLPLRFKIPGKPCFFADLISVQISRLVSLLILSEG